MEILLVGLALFLGVHSISIFSQPFRDRVAIRFGERSWQALHGLISVIGLAFIVWGYGLVRQEPMVLYTPSLWLRHVALLLLLPMFPLLLATYLPGRIRQAVGHPMLAATKLWAFAHLLANGMLHDVLLFGAFLIWAVADRISMKWRSPPPAPVAPPSKLNDLVAIVGGLVLYAWFLLHGHAWLFGVPPLP